MRSIGVKVCTACRDEYIPSRGEPLCARCLQDPPDAGAGRVGLFEQPDSYRCSLCGMTFRVAEPANGSRENYCETTHCAEPGCGRLFWHMQQQRPGQRRHAIVGIWPDSMEVET